MNNNVTVFAKALGLLLALWLSYGSPDCITMETWILTSPWRTTRIHEIWGKGREGTVKEGVSEWLH